MDNIRPRPVNATLPVLAKGGLVVNNGVTDVAFPVGTNRQWLGSRDSTASNLVWTLNNQAAVAPEFTVNNSIVILNTTGFAWYPINGRAMLAGTAYTERLTMVVDTTAAAGFRAALDSTVAVDAGARFTLSGFCVSSAGVTLPTPSIIQGTQADFGSSIVWGAGTMDTGYNLVVIDILFRNFDSTAVMKIGFAQGAAVAVDTKIKNLSIQEWRVLKAA